MADIATAISAALDSGLRINNPTNISVYFAPPGETWSSGSSTTTTQSWNAYQIDQVFDALQQWENVANLSFSLTSDPDSADFTLALANLDPGLQGYFNLPNSGPYSGYGAFTFNTTIMSQQSGFGLDAGGVGYNLLLHEFGHGLGLLHPHADLDHGDVGLPGVHTYSDTGTWGLNQGVYTVMSYNRGWATDYNGETIDNGAAINNNFGYAMTPMAIDIAIIQSMYGANTTYASGDNTYILPTLNQSGTGYQSIWDTGGNDTIINSGNGSATIDLRSATLQLEEGGGGYVSHTTNVIGGFTVAYGVVIENATGGSSADILIGNAADNVLTGLDGNDTLNDTLGNDTLNGGRGNDILTVATGVNILDGGEGNDILIGGAQSDTLYGGDGSDGLIGDGASEIWGGSDTLEGGAGDDFLQGGVGADTFRFGTNAGHDTIAAFDANTFNPNLSSMTNLTGADFESGQDQIVLIGFEDVDEDNVMSFVEARNGTMTFSAEGTTIVFHDVTTLGSSDFLFE